MKFIILLSSICLLNMAVVADDAFITTKVFKYSSTSGVPVFTDKEPKNRSHETKIIEAAKSTGKGYPITIFNDQVTHSTRTHKSSKRSSKKKRKHLAQCKKYKRKFDAVSEKMRVGYKASQYRALEKKRVKYRDLLFYECNSHDLL